MTERLIWERDGRDWPHRDASRFVEAGGLRWHVQAFGAPAASALPKPVLLLIHGTGASTHSWRGLAPLLAGHFHVVAADLPGHAFTSTPPARELTLPGMARALGALVGALGLEVSASVGHSAGAAIAARMALDGLMRPRAFVSLNGAFFRMGGLPGLVFPPAARLMAATKLAPRLFAWSASDRAAVERLVAGTGSTLDASGIDLYARLVRDVGHASGALAMMAHWDLAPLARDLPRLPLHLQGPLHLVVGAADRAVPPEQARRLQALLPRGSEARLHLMPGAGHLAHEERPAEVAAIVLAALPPPAEANQPVRSEDRSWQ